ncbi:MAG: putative enoyl-CoA hydratase [Frankiales bacterium]|nr:putative enoyl-CoA hydratase [Frankiales bacterium]
MLLDVTSGVATLTLNRPEGMNSLTVEAKVGLNEAVRAIAADPSVRALVLTGSGRAFCVGQDLKEHAALFDAGDAAPLNTVAVHYNPLVTMLFELPIPTIAAINGTAAGAGLGLACALDLRVGATGSKYTTAFAGIGLTADSGLSWTLPRLVGAGRAAALLLLAQPFTAEHALEMGLVNMVVPPEQVLEVATELAQKLAVGPTAAYGLIKESTRFAWDNSLVDTLGKEDELQTLAGQTADHLAAVRSFLAKQPPVFEGR